MVCVELHATAMNCVFVHMWDMNIWLGVDNCHIFPFITFCIDITWTETEVAREHAPNGH